MQIDYALDKGKFTKVYNELKMGNDEIIVVDHYNLLDRYNVTKDSTLKDIIYAINNNLSFRISDINEIKKIEDMYSYYENPNRLTKGEIIDCILEIDHVSFGLMRTGSFIKEVKLLKTSKGVEIFILINILGENIAIVKPAGKLNEIIELVQQQYNIIKTQEQVEIHHTPKSYGFLGTIKHWFS